MESCWEKKAIVENLFLKVAEDHRHSWWHREDIEWQMDNNDSDTKSNSEKLGFVQLF